MKHVSQEKIERINAANMLIKEIANRGRRFFRYKDSVAYIFSSPHGHLFLHNEWTHKDIYISRYGKWNGFHHGGTLHGLMGNLVTFIKTGERFKPWYFDAVHWGYFDDMEYVIKVGQEYGVIEIV